MIFVYKVNGKMVGVAAESGTVAKYGITQRYPDQEFRYLGKFQDFFQVNGNMIIDADCSIVNEVKEVHDPDSSTKEENPEGKE